MHRPNATHSATRGLAARTSADATKSPAGGGCRCDHWCYISTNRAQLNGVDMLDAYIIERIRRERDSRQGERPRLQIEMPTPQRWEPQEPQPGLDRRDDDDRERGVAIIDFSI